jgi:hypothetical protein
MSRVPTFFIESQETPGICASILYNRYIICYIQYYTFYANHIHRFHLHKNFNIALF